MLYHVMYSSELSCRLKQDISCKENLALVFKAQIAINLYRHEEKHQLHFLRLADIRKDIIKWYIEGNWHVEKIVSLKCLIFKRTSLVLLIGISYSKSS